MQFDLYNFMRKKRLKGHFILNSVGLQYQNQSFRVDKILLTVENYVTIDMLSVLGGLFTSLSANLQQEQKSKCNSCINFPNFYFDCAENLHV